MQEFSGSFRYFALFKPYGVLSQFTDNSRNSRVLGELHDFPGDVYPVGRLDKDSEGLLLITNDRHINHRLLNPRNSHEREYWVQVHGMPDEQALNELEGGVTIRINSKDYLTRPAKAHVLEPQPAIPARKPPIGPRGDKPVTWMSLTLIEGKNRQVRRMTAAAGYPTLRLIRRRIAQIDIKGMDIGQVKEYDRESFYHLLFGNDKTSVNVSR